ncbi:hypothetical protein QQ045_030391 [Rhodiola kirilowii]
MASDMYSYEDSEDDYIDMEVGTYVNFFDQSQGSPSSPREFEFQMYSNSLRKDSTTSPADELFYQGKLLPLHLPPRLQMVEKILQSTSSVCSYACRTDASEELFSTAINTPTSNCTPFESCNISPSESFRMSKEIIQEAYKLEYANASDFVMEDAKKFAAKRTKYSLLGLKLKASKAFLKCLFSKSSCSRDSAAAAFRSTQEGSFKKAKEISSNAYKKTAKKTPFGQIQKENKRQTSVEVIGRCGEKDRGYGGHHRRSLSGVIKHHQTTKSISSSSTSSASSSSSSSSDSIGFQELPFFNKSSSASSDIEMSIKGAIAHCKQSQQTRTTPFCS